MLCANYVARYRILALNPAAAKALRQLAGGQARLQARFSSAHDRRHQGTLLASAVEAWCPTDATCPPPAGHTVKVDEAANGSDLPPAPGDPLPVAPPPTYSTVNPPSDSAALPPARGP